MAISYGIIKVRRGKYESFDESKMLEGELAVATDRPAMWFCYQNGKCKRLMLSDEEISKATESIFGGIKADERLVDDTVPVRIGEDGKLYVKKYPKHLPASDVKEWAKKDSPDTTLSQKGEAADAKATGKAITELSNNFGNLSFSVSEADGGLDITYTNNA